MNKIFGSIAASAVAGLVLTSAAFGQGEAATKPAPDAAKKMSCQNNTCKGKSACKGFGNDSCKGQNACKGHGTVHAKTEAACKKKGGTWAESM